MNRILMNKKKQDIFKVAKREEIKKPKKIKKQENQENQENQ